ncbi:MAG: inorganic phosphate transporter [Candidatus Verstraetearchaeota archaeon]|nr:inorganic phosphate transporter [Candidatus Verstraetearchaeota archaeon]
MEPSAFLLVALATITSCMIGANNASNATATLTGSKVIPHEGGSVIFALGLVSGAVFEGEKLSRAIEGGALEGSLGTWSVGVILGVTICMIIVATAMGFPLPVAQALYGAAMGSGIFLGIPLNAHSVTSVLISWGTTPLMAAGASTVISRLERRLPARSVMTITMTYGTLTIGTCFYTAYVFGANTIGLIAGMLRGEFGWPFSVAVTAASAGLGGAIFGRGVSATMGEGISSMGPRTASAAQMGGALTVHLFTQLGMPVSITHAIVGGVTGSALSKGITAINFATWIRIALLWIVTPLVTLAMAWLIHASALG